MNTSHHWTVNVSDRAHAALAEARRLGPRGTGRMALKQLQMGARLALIPLVAGLLGSTAALVTMGALRVALGIPTLPELFGERLLLLLNVNQFVQLLLRYAPNSKTTPLLMALEGQFVVGILLGPVYALATRLPLALRSGRLPGRREWIVAGALVAGMEALTLLLFWPVLFDNTQGDTVGTARLINSLGALLVFVVFVGLIALTNRWLRLAWGARLATLEATPAERADSGREDGWTVSRRAALGAAGAVVVGVGAGALATRELIDSYVARSNLSYEGMETPYTVSEATQLTPTADFYVVSKNVLDPTVQAGRWRLEVAGMVNQARTWTMDDVQAISGETRAITLECIANGPGGHLMSTAEWTGISLERALSLAGGAANDSAKYVIFSSVDGFQSSLPLADLLEARAMLAYRMNGVRLPDRHGYPLRVVTPGRYGEQSPKWLTRIELSDQPFKGLYQAQGWRDGQIYTTSRIERPINKQRIPLAPFNVTGLAYAGIRGVQRVEVSTDGGASWSRATLKPPLSDQTWVYWSYLWTPSRPGAYTFVVRATDGAGAIQTPIQTSTVPNGATGQHHVPVVVG